MTRPLLKHTLDQLRAHVERNQSNEAELELVRSELSHRSTDAARRLKSSIEQMIAVLITAKRRGYSTNVEDSEAVKDTISDQVRDWTYEAIAKLRAKLIDLSRKSPLISFKHASRSASQLRFVDERIDTLWEALCNGTMGFEPLPGEEQTPPDERTPQFKIAYERARLTDEVFQSETEKLGDHEGDARAWQDAEHLLRARVREHLGLPKLDYGPQLDVAAIAKAHGFDPSFDLKFSDDEGFSEHHDDDLIRVLQTRKELEKRLKTIWDRAGTHLRETGLHTLHLAFGFVQWFEDDASEIANYAPLLLLPVSLDRQVVKGRFEYTIRATGDELEVNIALVEKAATHWGIKMPDLRNEESPESLFIRAKMILAQGRRLKLFNYVTLAVLPPMVLWKDLDPGAWPADAFAKHRLLPGLLGATEFQQSSGDNEEIDIDDPVNASRVPALIDVADASQHRAIIDMADGHDMAIQGPPGTGKSQTITNMIATALSQGKRVLFVAEKQAALRVVAERLRAAGFGPLLLELHGDRAVRSDVYASIRERLEYRLPHNAGRLEMERTELKRHRDMLRRYLALIQEPLGALGRTAFDLAWGEIRLRKEVTPDQVAAMDARWQPKDFKTLNQASLNERRELLDQFGQALTRLDKANGVRSGWARAGRLGAFDQSPALTAALAAADAAISVAQVAAQLEKLGIELPSANGAYRAVSDQLNTFIPFSCMDESVIVAALHSPEACQDLIGLQAEWSALRDALSHHMAAPATISASVVDELEASLAFERCPETVDQLRADSKKFARLCNELESAQRDTQRVAEQLLERTETSTANASVVCNCIMALDQLPTSCIPLLRHDLLDPATTSVIQLAISEAGDLLAERGAILKLFSADVLQIDPSELDATADSIESAGFFGRLAGQYRTAMRTATRYLHEVPSREAAADNLHRVASFLRATRTFEEKSKAKHLYPTLLWEGVDSDFESLRLSCEAVSSALNKCASIDETDVLKWWLGSEVTERQRFSASCSRLAPVLQELSDAGFEKNALHSSLETCRSHLNDLSRLEAATRSTELHDDCAFLWDGISVAERIRHLQEIRDRFDQARANAALAWIGEVGADLSALKIGQAELAAISHVSGPVDILSVLKVWPGPVAHFSDLIEQAAVLVASINDWEAKSSRLKSEIDIDPMELSGTDEWSQMANALRSLGIDKDGVSLAADLLKYRAALEVCELDEFAIAGVDGVIDPAKLADLYELLAVAALLRWYLGADGNELSRLGSLSLDAARKSFRQVDKALHKLEAAAIVASRLSDHVPSGKAYGRKSEYTELGLITNEVELTRPRTPLRDVAHRAGSALQALKPVWMMSPTSVAQFIRPGTLSFDLLIVDEASQMRPEFSVSCMLRGEQFVVVGDPNQLPPSDHFKVAGNIDEDDDSVGVDENTESILDLANQRFRKKPRLKWHYRSQHESLIQFSNREFYDRDLIVFPSPTASDDDLLGVKCFYVPSIHADTSYEASINQREAEVIIEQAFGLMQSHPERSIGIVAMNAKQTELIQNEFDRLIVEEVRVAKYVDAFSGGVEEFFIKNLENVQGDERDIILISTVYGPGKEGKVRQNFGLMNREVGWRRLNVLVTRAKMSCRLITSLRPDDIKVTESSSKGVLALKSYLTYAHQGAQYDDAAGGEADSDFEIFVADAIRGAGYEVVYQVGVEKFRIDLGIRHESCPVGFIAGIECDGAAFHSGFSVRDRDHIRQTVLEGLGWRIYRVWSTDWFSDPARETAKLISWLDDLRERVVLSLSRDQVGHLKVVTPALPIDGLEEADTLDVAQSTSSESPETLETSEVPFDAAIREPNGRKLRSLDDIDPYEAIRGSLYEIWKGELFLGEVEVIKRATANPRLYGDRVMTTQSEYEGRISQTGDSFRSFDLYAAMREVARRAEDISG